MLNITLKHYKFETLSKIYDTALNVLRLQGLVKAISSRLIEKLSKTIKDKLFPSYSQALINAFVKRMNIHSKSKYDGKCHNHTLQTNPRYRDEDTHNTNTHAALKKQLQ